ncbi:superoxide dismutase [bacterium]|nr:superoxide dismutase [bacterium]
MRMKTLAWAGVCLWVVAAPGRVAAHCEIPCGIYGDELRFEMIDEHLATIQKGMSQIKMLSASPEKDYNQIVRWVANKEEHAAQLREILVVYFLDQRIKPVADKGSEAYKTYLAQLETIHGMLVTIVKCKQTTDESQVEKLRELRGQLYAMYFGKDHEKHTH